MGGKRRGGYPSARDVQESTNAYPQPALDSSPLASATTTCADIGGTGMARWEEIVAEASGIEIEAMRFDQEGSAAAAAECYRLAAAKLLEAGECVPENHAVRTLVERRADEMSARVAHLERLRGTGSTVSIDQHLSDARLTTQGILASSLAASAGASASSKRDTKTMGMAAAIGSTAGLIVGGPVSAAALGVAAAYATTREDGTGAAARRMSAYGRHVADRGLCGGLRVADRALDESRKRLLEGREGKDEISSEAMTRLAAACGALKEALPKEQISDEARRMRARYPDRIPTICVRAPNSTLPDIDKKKFAVPGSMLLGEFKYIIHKQVAKSVHSGVKMDQTIYVFVNGISPKTGATMLELYSQHKSEDGFLYVTYCAENTLGRRHECR